MRINGLNNIEKCGLRSWSAGTLVSGALLVTGMLIGGLVIGGKVSAPGWQTLAISLIVSGTAIAIPSFSGAIILQRARCLKQKEKENIFNAFL